MPAIFTESTFEQAIIALFETMGYTHIYAPDLNRTDYTRPLLDEHLRESLVRINRGLPGAAIDEAVSVTLLSGSLTEKLIPVLHYEDVRFSGPFDRMEDAVRSAYGAALSHRGRRDSSEIILLSPGAYADEHFANEFERGAAFRAAVEAIGASEKG